MDRNYLKGRDGDRANAVPAAAGYTSPSLLRWLRRLLAPSSLCSSRAPGAAMPEKAAQPFITNDNTAHEYPRSRSAWNAACRQFLRQRLEMALVLHY